MGFGLPHKPEQNAWKTYNAFKGEEVSKETEEGEDKCETSKMTLLKTLTGPLQLLQVMQTAFK